MSLRFVVFGVPQPQGSAKSFGFIPKNKATGLPILNRRGKPLIRTVTTSDNPNLKSWRQLVAEGANRALTGRGVLLDGAVGVAARFYLPRPKSLGKKAKPHLTRPDADKLCRGILDAITGVLFRDDSQVVHIAVSKHYAAVGESPRAEISVTDGADQPPLDFRRTE